MGKRITITIEVDIPDKENHQLPEWVLTKTNTEIELYCDDLVDDFIRDNLILEDDYHSGNYTQVEEWGD